MGLKRKRECTFFQSLQRQTLKICKVAKEAPPLQCKRFVLSLPPIEAPYYCRYFHDEGPSVSTIEARELWPSFEICPGLSPSSIEEDAALTGRPVIKPSSSQIIMYRF